MWFEKGPLFNKLWHILLYIKKSGSYIFIAHIHSCLKQKKQQQIANRPLTYQFKHTKKKQYFEDIWVCVCINYEPPSVTTKKGPKYHLNTPF